MNVISIQLPETAETKSVAALLNELEERGVKLGEVYAEATDLDYQHLFGKDYGEGCDYNYRNVIRWNTESQLWERSSGNMPWRPCFRAFALGLTVDNALEVWQLYFLNMLENIVPEGACIGYDDSSTDPVDLEAYNAFKEWCPI